MIKVGIGDGTGSGNEAKVLSDNSLLVTANVFPPAGNTGTQSQLRYLSGYLGSTGFNSGTTNANVNGSVTNQTFYISSNGDYDIHITKLFIYIQDNTVSHSGFGALAALTNGIDIGLLEGSETIYLIQSAKTFADLIEQTLAERPFGAAADAFELESVSGTEDAQVLPFDIGSIIPGGIRIGRGTLDKVQLTVKDNLTGLTAFRVRVFGFRNYPLGAGE